MKLQLLIIGILLQTTLFGQILTSSDLEGKRKPKGEFRSYVSKRGSTYKIGDILTIGVPSNGDYFIYITEGDGILTASKQVESKATGKKSSIKKISIGGNRLTGYYVKLKCSGVVGAKAKSGLINYHIKLEEAIEAKEIKPFGMTREEAIKELKFAKEKFELELITEEEYNKIKEELKKSIN